jgi:hypothetical protein
MSDERWSSSRLFGERKVQDDRDGFVHNSFQECFCFGFHCVVTAIVSFTIPFSKDVNNVLDGFLKTSPSNSTLLRQAKLAVDPSSFGVLQIHQEKNI